MSLDNILGSEGKSLKKTLSVGALSLVLALYPSNHFDPNTNSYNLTQGFQSAGFIPRGAEHINSVLDDNSLAVPIPDISEEKYRGVVGDGEPVISYSFTFR